MVVPGGRKGRGLVPATHNIVVAEPLLAVSRVRLCHAKENVAEKAIKKKNMGKFLPTGFHECASWHLAPCTHSVHRLK